MGSQLRPARPGRARAACCSTYIVLLALELVEFVGHLVFGTACRIARDIPTLGLFSVADRFDKIKREMRQFRITAMN